MALTWWTLLAGIALLVSPLAVIALNKWRQSAGWWAISGVAVLLVIGNIIERLAA